MAYANIIGRKEEIKVLERLFKSRKSEFVAIYGRRRVGKSFLVNEVFGKNILFKVVGTYLKDGDKNYESYRKTQLDHFYDSLLFAGLSPDEARPTSWREAFLLLRKVLQAKEEKRKVIFIDELPWLAGPQSSEMIAELGYFWNSWADSERNIVLVVCGSATSWMLDNVIHDYGGLHGRLTEKMRLMPFTLSECEKYYNKHGFHLSRYEICVSYMALGGIPYYLDKLRTDLTITDNIDRIFFGNELIHQEFMDVYTGLYASKERYVDIVKALGCQFYGMTQAEISKATGISTGGSLTTLLNNLHESGIVRQYPRYGKQRVENVYQLKDFFSLFYLRFAHKKQVKPGGWNDLFGKGEYYQWAGDTFELLCIEHMAQIEEALRLRSVDRDYCFSGETAEGVGAQIDLIMESKAANTDFLCEMKFSGSKYAITADYERNLLNKIDAFAVSKMHKSMRSIQVILITTMGLAPGIHTSLINHTITLADLFASKP